MVQRKRDITYSCRLTEEEKATIDSINQNLAVCTTREGLIAAYKLAAKYPQEMQSLLHAIRSGDNG